MSLAVVVALIAGHQGRFGQQAAMKSLSLLCLQQLPEKQLKNLKNNIECVCVCVLDENERVCERSAENELRVIVFVVVVIVPVLVRCRDCGRWCHAHHGGVWGEGHGARRLRRSHVAHWDHVGHVHILRGGVGAVGAQEQVLTSEESCAFYAQTAF